MEVPREVWEWLTDLHALAVDQPTFKGDRAVLSDEDTALAESGIMIGRLLEHVGAELGVEVQLQLSEDHTRSAASYNWGLIWPVLSQFHLDLDEDTQSLILAGDLDIISEVLEDLRCLGADTDDEGGHDVNEVRELDPDAAVGIAAQEQEDMSDPDAPNDPLSADLGHIASSPPASSTLMDLVRSSMASAFELSPSQVNAMLDNNYKYLAHALLHGMRGSFRPVLAWMNQLIDNVTAIARRIESSKAQCGLFIELTKPAFCSDSTQIAIRCCELYADIGHSMVGASAARHLWDAFSTPDSGLNQAIAGALANAELVRHVFRMLNALTNGHLPTALGDTLRASCKSQAQYLGALQLFMPSVQALVDSAGEITSQLKAVIDLLAKASIAAADISSSDQMRCDGLAMMAELLVCFPTVMEVTGGLGDTVLRLFQAAARDRTLPVQITALAGLSRVLCTTPSTILMGRTLRALVFALVENHRNSAASEYVTSSLTSVLPRQSRLDVDTLVDPLLRQAQVVGYSNAELSLFLAVAKHPQLSTAAGLKLLDVLSKIVLNDPVYSRAAVLPLLVVINRFGHTAEGVECVLKLVQVSMRLFTSCGRPAPDGSSPSKKIIAVRRTIIQEAVGKVLLLRPTGVADKARGILSRAAIEYAHEYGQIHPSIAMLLALCDTWPGSPHRVVVEPMPLIGSPDFKAAGGPLLSSPLQEDVPQPTPHSLRLDQPSDDEGHGAGPETSDGSDHEGPDAEVAPLDLAAELERSSSPEDNAQPASLIPRLRRPARPSQPSQGGNPATNARSRAQRDIEELKAKQLAAEAAAAEKAEKERAREAKIRKQLEAEREARRAGKRDAPHASPAHPAAAAGGGNDGAGTAISAATAATADHQLLLERAGYVLDSDRAAIERNALRLFRPWRRPLRAIFKRYAAFGLASAGRQLSFEDQEHAKRNLALTEWIRLCIDFDLIPQHVTRQGATAVFFKCNMREAVAAARPLMSVAEFFSCLRVAVYAMDPSLGAGERATLPQEQAATSTFCDYLLAVVKEAFAQNAKCLQGSPQEWLAPRHTEYEIPASLGLPESTVVALEILDSILSEAIGVHLLMSARASAPRAQPDDDGDVGAGGGSARNLDAIASAASPFGTDVMRSFSRRSKPIAKFVVNMLAEMSDAVASGNAKSQLLKKYHFTPGVANLSAWTLRPEVAARRTQRAAAARERRRRTTMRRQVDGSNMHLSPSMQDLLSPAGSSVSAPSASPAASAVPRVAEQETEASKAHAAVRAEEKAKELEAKRREAEAKAEARRLKRQQELQDQVKAAQEVRRAKEQELLREAQAVNAAAEAEAKRRAALEEKRRQAKAAQVAEYARQKEEQRRAALAAAKESADRERAERAQRVAAYKQKKAQQAAERDKVWAEVDAAAVAGDAGEVVDTDRSALDLADMLEDPAASGRFDEPEMPSTDRSAFEQQEPAEFEQQEPAGFEQQEPAEFDPQDPFNDFDEPVHQAAGEADVEQGQADDVAQEDTVEEPVFAPPPAAADGEGDEVAGVDDVPVTDEVAPAPTDDEPVADNVPEPTDAQATDEVAPPAADDEPVADNAPAPADVQVTDDAQATEEAPASDAAETATSPPQDNPVE